MVYLVYKKNKEGVYVLVVFYDSLTGQGRRFAEKLGLDDSQLKDIGELNLSDIPEHMVLITRSFNYGDVPSSTLDFLDDLKDANALDRLLGTAVTGNKIWGTNYGKAGITIAHDYNVPNLITFEASGFKKDVIALQELLKPYIEKEPN